MPNDEIIQYSFYHTFKKKKNDCEHLYLYMSPLIDKPNISSHILPSISGTLDRLVRLISTYFLKMSENRGS